MAYSRRRAPAKKAAPKTVVHNHFYGKAPPRKPTRARAPARRRY